MADIVPISERPNRARALALMNRRLEHAQALDPVTEREGDEDGAAAAVLDRLDRIYGKGASDE